MKFRTKLIAGFLLIALMVRIAGAITIIEFKISIPFLL